MRKEELCIGNIVIFKYATEDISTNIYARIKELHTNYVILENQNSIDEIKCKYDLIEPVKITNAILDKIYYIDDKQYSFEKDNSTELCSRVLYVKNEYKKKEKIEMMRFYFIGLGDEENVFCFKFNKDHCFNSVTNLHELQNFVSIINKKNSIFFYLC